MSYCVNCGVELEKSIKQCPMCNTRVINPNDLEKLRKIESPYPEKKGTVEFASKKDAIIILSVIFASTAISCALLNIIVFTGSKWSLLIAGVCGLFWLITVPPLMVRNFKKRIYVLYNGLMVCIYLGLIGIFIDSTDWVIQLAIPITLMTMFFVEVFLSVGKITRNFLPLATTAFLSAGIECCGIELLIERVTLKGYRLTWSAIVLTVCCVISIVLLTVVSRKKLRNQLHRRFHL